MARFKDALEVIPGVGPRIAKMLHALGIEHPSDLCGKDPEVLYRDYEALVGHRVDRCVLYTFRCAVYYAQTPDPDPELLKWWNWKEKR